MKLKVITSNPGKVAEYARSFSEIGIEMDGCALALAEIEVDA